MKKYLTEIIFYFLIPLILMGVLVEYSIRKIPNDYAYKNEWLSKNSQDVEILALGASSILHDINPEYFNKKGFNAAHLSQSLKYDNFIFSKFIDDMPSLEYVILGVDYWSPFGSMEDSPENWRIKYYNIHYGSKIHRWEGKYNYEIYYLNTGTLKIAMGGLLTTLGLRNYSHRTVNELGYGVNYTLNNRMPEWDNGDFEALRHNELISSSISDKAISENKQYVEDIIRKCAEKDIKVLIVNSPLYKSYLDNQKNEYLEQQKSFCNYFAENYSNVELYDFRGDIRFTENDFYDSNHLNEIGSKKFTMILDSVIVNQ